MADVVLNSLGANTWENNFSCVGLNGRWVTFGGLTGADVKLNIQSLYRKQIKVIGSNGSTRKEFKEVIDMSKELKVRVWKRFSLEDAKEALQALFAKERDCRILLDINNTYDLIIYDILLVYVRLALLVRKNMDKYSENGL